MRAGNAERLMPCEAAVPGPRDAACSAPGAADAAPYRQRRRAVGVNAVQEYPFGRTIPVSRWPVWLAGEDKAEPGAREEVGLPCPECLRLFSCIDLLSF